MSSFIPSRTVIVDRVMVTKAQYRGECTVGNASTRVDSIIKNTTMGLWGNNYTNQRYFLCQSTVVHMLCTQLLCCVLCPRVWRGSRSFLSTITQINVNDISLWIVNRGQASKQQYNEKLLVQSVLVFSHSPPSILFYRFECWRSKDMRCCI